MTQARKAAGTRPTWYTNLLLFLATVASVLLTGVANMGSDASNDTPGSGSVGQEIARALGSPNALARGAEFAGTLLSILVAHELGHYLAARVHKVKASLPYFIPLPLLSPFGTMGAVIRMRGTIPTRRALLDIGASGPLAGLLFAIPLYVWGIAHSSLVTIGDDTIWFGESILMKMIHRLVGPPIPEGMDIQLSPAGFGAWGGLFVTMINLLPVGQLDGGHVAYALFGPKQDRVARFVHRSMLAFFFVVVFGHLARDLYSGVGAYHLGRHVANSMFWLVWFQVLAILGTLSRDRERARITPYRMISIRTRIVSTVGLLVMANLARDHHHPIYLLAFFTGLALLLAMEVKGGTLRHHDLLEHPETASTPLNGWRKAIAVLTLLMFVLLFMPEPFSI